MAIYYVKNGGSDSNTGLSDAQAFATLEKAHTEAVAGDQILLKRGSNWYGFTPQKAGSVGNPITWGAYGEGDIPVIHGFLTLTGWESLGGGLYKVTNSNFPSRINFVTAENEQKTHARGPWWQINAATGNTTGTITNNTFLNSSVQNYTGAEVVIKKLQWVVDRCSITAHSGGTINYTGGNSVYNTLVNWGFFIQNHRSLCDALFDFCQEGNDIVMYFGANDPNEYEIEVPMLSQINFNNRGYNTFQGIRFEGFNGGTNANGESAIFRFSGSQQVKFYDCEFEFMGNTFVYPEANNNNDFEFDSCEFKNFLNSIIWNRYTGSGLTNRFKFNNNVCENIANVYGAGANGSIGYTGISSSGSGEYVEIVGNRMKNIGYNGTNITGYGFLVANNEIDNFCSIKHDGGGIYMYGSGDRDKTYNKVNRIVEKNKLINGIGNNEGEPGFFNSVTASHFSCFGIYLDNDTKDVTVRGNLAYNNKYGLFVHDNQNNLVQGNLFVNNGFAQVFWANSTMAGTYDIRNIEFVNNILYCAGTQYAHWIESKQNDFNQFCTEMDNNYYIKPTGGNVVRLIRSDQGFSQTNHTLSSWKAVGWYDANTEGSPTSSDEYIIVENLTDSPLMSDIERIRMDVDGVTVDSDFTVDPFQFFLLLDDLGALVPGEIFTVTATAGEGGSVTGGGTYESGTTATLTAIPDEGFEFVQWSNSSEANPYLFTVTGNVTIAATFQPIPTPGATIIVKGRFRII